MSDENITHKCGAKTSSCPRLDLIPYEAQVRQAARFELGLERYEKDNWRKGLRDNDYVAGRIAHLLNHGARFLAKMEGRLADDGEDDAGAILWAGAFLACRTTCPCGATIRPIQAHCDACEDALKQVSEGASIRAHDS
jgi:hypothetical protein